MQVNTLTLQNIFEKDVLYKCPLYQRPYIWEREKQLEPLWEDMLRLSEKLLAGDTPRAHFMGASVQNIDQGPPGSIEKRLLVDGQQRLTTLQLILKAFEDALGDEQDDKYKKSIKKLTKNDHPLSNKDEESFKVWPTNADRDDFSKTMKAGNRAKLLVAYGKRADSKSVGHNIPDAYLFFSEKILAWLYDEESEFPPEGKVKALYSALRENVRIVVIDLDANDDAQLIFETLNARGTPLLAADLVKNSILSEIEAQEESAEQAYEDYWGHFDTDQKFWRQEIGRGHAKRPRIEIFLQHVLMLLGKQDILAGHLYQAYHNLNEDSQLGTPIDRLRNIHKYSLIYKELIEGYDNSRIQVFLDRLHGMDVGTAYPFLLEVFDRLREDPQLLIPVLENVESFLVRRMVCKLNTRGYGSLFLELLKVIDNCRKEDILSRLTLKLLSWESKSDRWPHDKEFKKAWLEELWYGNIALQRLRLLLVALERELRKDQHAETQDVPDGLTIEHLMPKSWEEHWPLPENTDSEERENIIHTIGNLTLLNDKLNPAQSNNPWIIGDVPETGKREGLHEHSVLFLNKDLCRHDTWDEQKIKERGEDLFKIACDIWEYPPA